MNYTEIPVGDEQEAGTETMESLFGNVISSYSRAQGIEDGGLIDVSDTSKEAGIKYPVAITHAAWVDVVEPDRFALRHGESVAGRLWDVLWMLKVHAQTHFGQELTYTLIATKGGHQRHVHLKAICGPGDTLDPVITIMLPGED